MSTSGMIERMCKPYMDWHRPGAAAERAAATEKTRALARRAAREALVAKRPLPLRLQLAAARPAPLPSVHLEDTVEEARYAAHDWKGYTDEPQDEEDFPAADAEKVEEYLLAMFPAADVAVVQDVVSCAVATTGGTFAAIDWGKQQLRELLRPQPAKPTWTVVEPEPQVEWVVEEVATPRSVLSEASWADCGPAAPKRSYAAVASLPGTGSTGAAAAPAVQSAPQTRRARVRECPTIPEAEAAKEERVYSGEQRRFELLKEKRHSAPRARRLERRAARCAAQEGEATQLRLGLVC